MNYLSLTQKVDTLLGSQGTISNVTATGYQGMLAAYVKNAWLNIQALKQDWHFLRSKVDITLTTASPNYSILNIFPASLGVDPVGIWITDRFILPDLSTLTYIPYDHWILQDHTVASPPDSFTIHPYTSTGYLTFNTVDSTYTVTAHYFRKPQELTANADVPICPSEYHDVITFTALADLAAFLGNTELYSIASTRADSLLGDLMRSQNPGKRVKVRSAC